MINPTGRGAPNRPLRARDHVTCHGLPYTVVRIDVTGCRADLIPGDTADHPGTIGRIFVPVGDLEWRA